MTDGTTAAKNGTVLDEHNVTFDYARFDKGALITDITRLEYSCDIPETYSMCFWMKKSTPFDDCTIITLKSTKTGNTLYIGYDKHYKRFYVKDNVQDKMLFLEIDTTERDWVFIGISQSVNTRMLFVKEINYNQTKYIKDSIPACGTFDNLCLSQKGDINADKR